jgi:hypothetical protein
MVVAPAYLLLACVAVTVLAWLVQAIVDGKRRRRLRRIAAGSGFHFASNDRFKLAARAAERFPIPDVRRPRVSDVIYGRRGERYCYVFRFDYTTSDARRPRRHSAIVTATEAQKPIGDDPPPTPALHLNVIEDGETDLARYERAVGELTNQIGNSSP